MSEPYGDWEHTRRIVYDGGATFVPVCETCCRFVKPDETIRSSDEAGLSPDMNATCSKCGRTRMVFEGFVSYEEAT